MPFISDTTHEEKVYTLLTRLFEENNILSDPTDYSIVSVEQNIANITSNTILNLAPINTNLGLPNLIIFYNRVDIQTLVEENNLSIPVATKEDNAYKLLPIIKQQLKSEYSLFEEDIYNTFVATQPAPDNAFLVLSALPESFFYNGSYRVTVNFVPSELTLSFNLIKEDKVDVV